MTRAMPIVAICGNDGAGKSKNIAGLKAYLLARSLPFDSVDKWDILDSRMHSTCSFISTQLNPLRVQISEMPSPARMLFLMWSISITADRIRHASNKVILLDGYWMKHAAAEIAMGGSSAAIRTVAGLLPVPDITIFLDIDPLVALERKRGDLTPYECACDPSLSENSFLRHQGSVAEILNRWSDEFGWRRIDASQPPEIVLRNTIVELEKTLP